MSNVGPLATVASLIGEPARAAILVALMDGRWLSAGELCRAAGVGSPTGSQHLRQLLEGGLVSVHQQGRHRYYQLRGSDVAATIEQLMALSTTIDPQETRRRIRTGPRDPELRYVRVCYDHLAGQLPVAIAEQMQARGELKLTVDGGAITAAGVQLLEQLNLRPQGGVWDDMHFCRPCLDWSERKPHIGGAFGRALLQSFSDRGWVRRIQGTRTVGVTTAGWRGLEQAFGELPRAHDGCALRRC